MSLTTLDTRTPHGSVTNNIHLNGLLSRSVRSDAYIPICGRDISTGAHCADSFARRRPPIRANHEGQDERQDGEENASIIIRFQCDGYIYSLCGERAARYQRTRPYIMLDRAQRTREQRTRSQGRIVLSRRMLNARRYSWSSRFARVAARNDPLSGAKLRALQHPRDLHPPVVPRLRVYKYSCRHLKVPPDRRAFQDQDRVRLICYGARNSCA